MNIWWHVYGKDKGDYRAQCKGLGEATALIAFLGEGATIRVHKPDEAGNKKELVVWREGAEAQPAGESYNHVAETCLARLDKGEEAPAQKDK